MQAFATRRFLGLQVREECRDDEDTDGWVDLAEWVHVHPPEKEQSSPSPRSLQSNEEHGGKVDAQVQTLPSFSRVPAIFRFGNSSVSTDSAEVLSVQSCEMQPSAALGAGQEILPSFSAKPLSTLSPIPFTSFTMPSTPFTLDLLDPLCPPELSALNAANRNSIKSWYRNHHRDPETLKLAMQFVVHQLKVPRLSRKIWHSLCSQWAQTYYGEQFLWALGFLATLSSAGQNIVHGLSDAELSVMYSIVPFMVTALKALAGET